MSKFKLICEDEAMPFGGASKTRHEFEADDLFEILQNIIMFLRGSGYLGVNKTLSVERVVNLDDMDSDALDTYTENLFKK